MALLEVNELVVHIPVREGTVFAVNGISYALHAQEALATIGESGSGKSVHVLGMLGLLRGKAIVEGDVKFEGRSLLTMSERELSEIRGREIGYVPQDPMSSLNPVLTIQQQLEDTLQRHSSLGRGERRTRCEELLDMVGIVEPKRALEQYPHQLSGGMRQRVMIAMAVACGPKLLIADEPTTALDVTVQARIVEMVQRLRKQLGLAVLWITHDLAVTAMLAETVQVMYAGRMLERGPVRSIYRDPRNAYTYGLLRSTPDPRRQEQRLPQMDGQLPRATERVVGDPFAPRNPFATARCFEEMPPMLPVVDGEPGHEVAAWYDLKAELARRGGDAWK
ncbi:ABC transporter ATP-binding protein [Granulicella cerasi]|uniref:ABC transporter ATP-binding protein n=1 Tax=Granulicella cerasi TaxID=741063 RepID=A0ABW1ZDP5_9BACT|nr:ABC transporter ATP-binding protein [Granulicella cerasi]